MSCLNWLVLCPIYIQGTDCITKMVCCFLFNSWTFCERCKTDIFFQNVWFIDSHLCHKLLGIQENRHASVVNSGGSRIFQTGGIPKGGGANLLFGHFYWKLHENKENMAGDGEARLLDPPMVKTLIWVQYVWKAHRLHEPHSHVDRRNTSFSTEDTW